jgi:hypothetical protein
VGWIGFNDPGLDGVGGDAAEFSAFSRRFKHLYQADEALSLPNACLSNLSDAN